MHVNTVRVAGYVDARAVNHRQAGCGVDVGAEVVVRLVGLHSAVLAHVVASARPIRAGVWCSVFVGVHDCDDRFAFIAWADVQMQGHRSRSGCSTASGHNVDLERHPATTACAPRR